jgi:hypothetical protein
LTHAESLSEASLRLGAKARQTLHAGGRGGGGQGGEEGGESSGSGEDMAPEDFAVVGAQFVAQVGGGAEEGLDSEEWEQVGAGREERLANGRYGWPLKRPLLIPATAPKRPASEWHQSHVCPDGLCCEGEL